VIELPWKRVDSGTARDVAGVSSMAKPSASREQLARNNLMKMVALIGLNQKRIASQPIDERNVHSIVSTLFRPEDETGAATCGH
jgi:hypothetical protein